MSSSPGSVITLPAIAGFNATCGAGRKRPAVTNRSAATCNTVWTGSPSAQSNVMSCEQQGVDHRADETPSDASCSCESFVVADPPHDPATDPSTVAACRDRDDNRRPVGRKNPRQPTSIHRGSIGDAAGPDTKRTFSHRNRADGRAPEMGFEFNLRYRSPIGGGQQPASNCRDDQG